MFAVLRHNIGYKAGNGIMVWDIEDLEEAQDFYTEHNGYIEDAEGRPCGLWICEYDTRLDLIRQANDYTQAGLAKLTGIPFRTVQDYCQGRKKILNVSIDRVWKLAKALGCKMEDLIDVPADDPSHPFADDVMMGESIE